MARLWISGVDVAELIGSEKAEALLTEYAGRSVYIPKDASRQKFTPVVGEEANAILSREFPGIDCAFPSTVGRPAMKERIRELIEQGRTCTEVVRIVKCSERYCEMIRRDLKLPKPKVQKTLKPKRQKPRTGVTGEA